MNNMAIKIFISGSALRATYLNTGITVLDVLKKDVYYFQQQLQQPIPSIKIGLLPLVATDRALLSIPLSDALNENSAAFTAETFRQFCNDNLGKPNASEAEAEVEASATTNTLLGTLVK